jgi:formate hydrogenlyase subunit 3/multisubunit Na+/H+ antiporter MnhD subunit
VVIEAGLVALLRVMGAISGSSLAWGWLLLGFGLLNMTLGNLLALRQTQVKRLLAFSSISHVGYMLVGLGLAVTYGLHDGAAGAFFHLITHALMKGLAFLAVGALMYGLYLANHKHDALMVDDLNGASKRYPLAVFGLSIAVLGLGGLPPLAGFMSKWQIFVAGAEAQSTAALVIVIYMALNSVLSLGYYAPLVNRMYRKEPSPVILNGKRIGWQISLPLVLLTSAVILLGVYPTALSWLTDTAATSLLALFGAI